jgi:hypothetical protein
MIILGLDPGSEKTGWACLAPKSGQYALAAQGKFSPNRIADKTGADRYKATFDMTCWIIRSLGLQPNDSYVVVEHAAMGFVPGGGINLNKLEVTVSIGVSLRSAGWANKIPVLDVYPNSWIAMIRPPGHGSKASSRLLTEQEYGGMGLSEDICDAVAQAHWGSHMAKGKLFIDNKTRLLEEGFSDEELYKLGRKLAEGAYERVFFNRNTITKEESQNFIKQLREYQERLVTSRKLKRLAPQSKAKIAGHLPARIEKKTNDQFDRIAKAFEKMKK